MHAAAAAVSLRLSLTLKPSDELEWRQKRRPASSCEILQLLAWHDRKIAEKCDYLSWLTDPMPDECPGDHALIEITANGKRVYGN